MTKYKTVSLYSGAGGLDLGFKRAGFKIIWANDSDKTAVTNYQQLFPDHEITHGDITEMIQHGKLDNLGDVDVIIGGPPCQGFSVAGKLDPEDPRSKHVWVFLQVVASLKPTSFVMENVKSLGSGSRWQGLREGLKSFAENLGYNVSLHSLNSSHFGVPQSRERMFLIGTKCTNNVVIKTVTEDSPPTVRKVLEGLPQYGSPGNNTLCLAKIRCAKKPVLRPSPFAGMLFNGQGRPLNLESPAATLPASMGGNRTPIVDQYSLIDRATPWVVEYHDRLMAGDTPEEDAPERLRRITVEEAAAIQTFPKNLKWTGARTSMYRLIGNAVPPELAFHVASSLKEVLDTNT